MINLKLAVNFINSNATSNNIYDLIDECSKRYHCDFFDELQKNHYTFNEDKTKIVLKDELNAPEENSEKAIDTTVKMDYEKLLNFNSDSVFSVRIDSEINKKFQKFCKKNKKITKNKLVSLALYEFLIKYN